MLLCAAYRDAITVSSFFQVVKKNRGLAALNDQLQLALDDAK